MPRPAYLYLTTLLGAHALCLAAPEAPSAPGTVVDSINQFRSEAYTSKTREAAYSLFREYLPWAQGKGRVDTLFGTLLEDMNLSRRDSEGGRSGLAKRWVEDAVRETHEETRLWYSLGMNEVRKIPAGGVSLGQFKIRPGSEMDITWYDPENLRPPPTSMRVQLARFNGKDPSARGAYVPMDSGGFRTEGQFHVFRRRLERPGIYRVTVHGRDFFQQSYVQVSWLDLAVKDDGERFLAWGASPGNKVKPPYRIRVVGAGGFAKDTLTDSSGILLLELPKESLFRRSVRVSLDKDGNGAWSRGLPGEALESRLKGILFTDRPRYRPGDALHFQGIGKWLAGDRGLSDGWRGPVEVRILDGRRKEVFRRRMEVDPWGNFGDSLVIPPDAALGNWSAVARKPEEDMRKAGETVGFTWTAEFQVEEYRKPDFRLDATLDWHEEGKVSLKLQAGYFSGAPLGGIPVEVRWYAAPRYGSYAFGTRPPGWAWPWEMPLSQSPWYPGESYGQPLLRLDTVRLDAEGKGRFEGPSPVTLNAAGLDAELVARDRTGREVRTMVRARPMKKETALRVEMDRFRYEPGDFAWIKVEARAKDTAHPPAKAILQILRGGKAFLDTSLVLDRNGTALLGLPIAKPGQYSLHCRLPAPAPDSLKAEIRFLVVRMIGKGTVPILRLSVRRGLTVAGDSIRFDLHGNWRSSPILATLEGGSLAGWKILHAPGESYLAASLPLPAQAARRARIAVLYPGPLDWKRDWAEVDLPDTTFLLKASLEAAHTWKPGERFQGRIRVTDARGKPAKVRFSLGVVDEAIFAEGEPPQGGVTDLIPDRTGNRVRTRFGEKADDYLWALSGSGRTPRGARAGVPEGQNDWEPRDAEDWGNSHPDNSQGRRLGAHFTFGPVKIWDHLFRYGREDTAYVLMKLDGAIPIRVAGHRIAEQGYDTGDLPPRERSDFRDNAYWGASLVTDAKGMADVEFPWPDDLSQWRLRARGAGPGRSLLDFSDTLLTRQELMVRLAAPRSFTAGDSAMVTAMVRNGTGRVLDAEVRFESGDSSVAAPADSGYRQVTLRPGNLALGFPVRILKAGQARLRMILRTPEGGDAEARTFPVHGKGIRHVTYAGGFASRSDPGAAGQGEGEGHWEWSLPAGHEAGTAELAVEIFSSPALAFSRPLSLLLEYPYGCVEQTMSRFLPLLQVSALYKRLGIRDPLLEEKRDPYARRGLDRLAAMETRGGGWSWWAGSVLNPAMTAWVVEGLETARRAGLPADLQLRAEEMRRRGLKALGDAINATRDPPVELVDAVHALAEGRSAAKWLPYLSRPWEKRSELPIQSLAQLIEIYHGAGGKAEEEAVLIQLKSKLRLPERRGYGRYRDYPESEIMDMARALGALMVAAPGDANIPRLAAWLLTSRQGEGWGSTRATAAVLSVLSRHAEAQLSEPVEGRVSLLLNGRLLLSDTVRRGPDGMFALRFNLAGSALDSLLTHGGGNRLSVRHEGGGRLHYAAILSSRAAVAPPATDSSAPLRVTRSYRKIRYEAGAGNMIRKSAPLGSRPLKPGEEVEVVLDVDCPRGGGYVLVEDPFPAGMEYLPSTPGESGSSRRPYSYSYEHFEARDDRAAFFQTHLKAGRTTFRYLLRAETRGRFTARPARAELMYAPEINGHSRPAEFTVLR